MYRLHQLLLAQCCFASSAAVLAEHYADELEMELADTLLEEFHVEAEDGSPAQVWHQQALGDSCH